MPVLIQLKFDKGRSEYAKALDITFKQISNFKPLWKRFFKVLEDPKGQIVDIWKTKGRSIGKSWKNSKEYENWKTKNWLDKRDSRFAVGFKNFAGKWQQILTGRQLAGLLSSKVDGAVREAGKKSFAYGIENEYSHVQQANKGILDITTEMKERLDDTIDNWILENKALKGKKV